MKTFEVSREAFGARRPRLHFVGICGKGMGSIAAALAREGWVVTGSDEGVYAPMDAVLAEEGVHVRLPYGGENIPEDVELAIIGKRVREDNWELRALLDRGIPVASFPSFLREWFLCCSRNAVVAGGVGKTTVTAMLAWILEASGREPDWFVGGKARNLPGEARLRGAAITVIEGDEYATCFDDVRPKFDHYHPEALLITNLVEDHPDLYSGPEAVRVVFRDLVGRLPKDGLLVLPDDDAGAMALREAAPCAVVSSEFTVDADERIEVLGLRESESEFTVGGTRFVVPMTGRMNVKNAAMAALTARHFDVSLTEAAEVLSTFRGVENRQDIREVGGRTLVKDKATHPLAVTGLFEAIRQRYPGRRLVSVIQPRGTGGREWVYQRELPVVLSSVDAVVIVPSYEHQPAAGQTWPGGAFSVEQLAQEVAGAGGTVCLLGSDDSVGDVLPEVAPPGSVVVTTLPEQALALAAEIESSLLVA